MSIDASSYGRRPSGEIFRHRPAGYRKCAGKMSQAVITSDGRNPNLVLMWSPRSWEKKPSPAPMSATRIPGLTSGRTSCSTLSLVLRCEIGRISFSDTVSAMQHYRSRDCAGSGTGKVTYARECTHSQQHLCRSARQDTPELIQHLREVWFRVEDRQYRIRAQLLDLLERSPDRKRLRIERIVYLVPDERHGHRRARERTHTEGRNDGLSMTILQVIEIDFVATFRNVTRDRRNIIELASHA